MMPRLLTVTTWIALGHAALLGLFWLLLHVPESNVLMLAASALIVVAMAALAGWVEGTGLAAWTPGARWREVFLRGARVVVALWLGLALFGLVWWLTARAEAAWTASRGEIDAWLMLHFGWTRTARLHDAVEWVLFFVRWAVGTSLALTPAACALGRGLAGLGRLRWILAALSPLRVVSIGVLLFVFAWLPWRAAYWRPTWLLPNWQEAVFAVVKLGVLYAVATVGWALVLWVVARRVVAAPTVPAPAVPEQVVAVPEPSPAPLEPEPAAPPPTGSAI